jgi:CRP-like cAMP-binding protein
VIIRQGETGDDMMLVLSGTAEISVATRTGQRVVDTSHPGDVIGEVGFLSATERTATVTALEPMEVLVMNQASVQTRLQAYPRLAAQLHLNLARILGERLVRRARLQAAEAGAE